MFLKVKKKMRFQKYVILNFYFGKLWNNPLYPTIKCPNLPPPQTISKPYTLYTAPDKIDY